MLVSIITPSTGNPLLKQAIESVQAQDYDNIEHIIVIDGKERESATNKVLEKVQIDRQTHILSLPYPTGKDRYIGHRIYGMSSYIANGNYLIFLDEDNWFEKFHVSSLVDLILDRNLDWAYALRNIVNQDGEFITQDDCESLGKWAAFNNQYHHVDTNCYCLKKEIAVNFSPIWYRKFREPGVMNPDIALCNILIKEFPNCDTTGLYSVNYRIGSTELSVKPSFFLQGNTVMEAKYPDGFPWRKDSSLLEIKNSLIESFNLREINLIAFPDWSQNDVGLIHADLAELLQVVQANPDRSKITLLLHSSVDLAEKATSILWEFLIESLDNSLVNEELPEISLVSGMNAVQWQLLLSMLAGYISNDREDSVVVEQLARNKIPQWSNKPESRLEMNRKDSFSSHYSSAFYEERKTGSHQSAVKFYQHLFKYYVPRSIVDFGAANGTWLAAAKKLGINDVLAIDGDWVKEVERTDASIPYIFQNLEEPICLDRRFDLAVSLEVAEHLTPERAATFIDDICQASDLVMFGAAMKDQGGTHHINEQDQSYWIDLFNSRAYECIDFFRTPFWRDVTIDSWYTQNTFLFVKIGDPRRALFSNNPLLDVHHPRLLLKPIQLAKYGIFVPSPNT